MHTRRAVLGGLAVLAMAYALVASGCNTVKGVGRDVYTAADNVQEAMFY